MKHQCSWISTDYISGFSYLSRSSCLLFESQHLSRCSCLRLPTWVSRHSGACPCLETPLSSLSFSFQYNLNPSCSLLVTFPPLIFPWRKDSWSLSPSYKHTSPPVDEEILPSGTDVPLGFQASWPRWLLTRQIGDPFGVSVISFNIYSSPLNVWHAKQSVNCESDLQIEWGQGHLTCCLGLHCRVFDTAESDKVKKHSEATASWFVFAQPVRTNGCVDNSCFSVASSVARWKVNYSFQDTVVSLSIFFDEIMYTFNLIFSEWLDLTEKELLSFNRSVVCDSFVTPWTLALQAPLFMDFPGENTGVGCHFPLQGIFPTQPPNLHLLHLHGQVDSLPLVPPEKPPVRNSFWFICLQIFTSKRGVPCLGNMQVSLQTLSYCYWSK